MKKLLSVGALLLFTGAIFAQQPAPPPYNPPPYATAPTFPQEQKPTEPLPPDTKAPRPGSTASADVQEQIQKKLTTEPLLENANVNATADDKSVVLSGTVENEQQHKLAVRIAESYAGDRHIVDKLQVRQKA